MTHDITPASTPSASDWTPYDTLTGPKLDETLWEPLDMGTGPLLEPAAITTIGDGVWTLDIDELRNADADNQAFDNSKHVIFSTAGFSIPADGVGRFAVNMSAREIGDGDRGDYRFGVASFNVVDLATGQVFNILTTGDRFLAEHEVLAYPGQENPFTRVVDDPLFDDRSGVSGSGFRRCEVEIDRGLGRVRWLVDGKLLHEAAGLADLPAEVHIGIGIFTLIPIGHGISSLQGQGAHVSWSGFATSVQGS